MSNLNTIGLIAAVLIGSYGVFLFADRWIHNRGDAIATGLVHGVRLTTKHSWLMFINNWLMAVLSLIMFSLLVSFALLGIAQNVGDPFVQTLGYASAFAFSGIALVWIVLGGSWILHYWRILRQAEAD